MDKMGQKIGEIVVIIQQYGRFDGETPPFWSSEIIGTMFVFLNMNPLIHP